MPLTLPTLVYSSLFDDFDDIDIESLLEKVPTIGAVRLISDIEANLFMKDKIGNIQDEYYRIFINIFPYHLKVRFTHYFNEYYKNNGVKLLIVNSLFNVALIDYLLSSKNKVLDSDELDDADQLNLIKAYLYIGQKAIRKLKVNDIEKFHTDKEVCDIYMPSRAAYYDIYNTTNFASQAFKARIFFKFCETNDYFREYLGAFLRIRKVDSWKVYVGLIIKFYFQFVKDFRDVDGSHPNTFTLNIPPTEENSVIINLIESFCYNIENTTIEAGFLNLRRAPILKISQNDYTILNMNFFIEKLFQAIQFDFASITAAMNMKYENKIIQGYIDFKNNPYAKEFSEKIFFYTVIGEFLDKKKVNFKATGEQLKSYLKIGEPDYYYRDNGKLYFFEFKDTFLSSVAKFSGDYEVLYKEISSKLIKKENEKGKIQNKAIIQLANNIKYYIDNKGYYFDPYNGPAMIYPIIVVPDETFNSIGFNYVLKLEFEEIIENLLIEKGKYHIKGLTILTIDFFIENKKAFNSISLSKCILDYHNYTKGLKYSIERLMSFKEYYKRRVKQGKEKFATRESFPDDFFALMDEVYQDEWDLDNTL